MCDGEVKSDSVLWIDLRVTKQGPPVGASCGQDGGPVIHVLTDIHALDRTIRTLSPKILGFEYDYPDIAGLIALSQAKRAFPNVPILMLTGQHSETLAIWAFRQGVWDYFTPPLSTF